MGDSNSVNQAMYDPYTLSECGRSGFEPPPEFETSTNLRWWRRKMEFFLSPIPRDQQASYVLYLLSDTVLDIIFGADIPLGITVEEVWAALEENFGSRENPATFIRSFWDRSQEESESPDEFADALRVLVVKAYRDQPVKQRNFLLLQRFILGLRDPHLVDKFLRKPPASLKEALMKARSTVLDPTARTSPCLTAGPSNYRQTPDFHAPFSRPLPSQTIICYHCGKPGHIARKCPARDIGHSECQFLRKFDGRNAPCQPVTAQRNQVKPKSRSTQAVTKAPGTNQSKGNGEPKSRHE